MANSYSYVDNTVCKTYMFCSLFFLIHTSFCYLNTFPGFFVDINLFKADKEKVAEISKNSVNERGSSGTEKDDFADEDANLMVKLKFLTYKV